MSKGLKKLRKVAAKFDLGHKVGKGMGLPDPSGDLLYGSAKTLTPAEMAQKQAQDMQEQQLQQSNAEMALQASMANQQSQQSVQNQQMLADRDVVTKEAAEATEISREAPTIELTDSQVSPRKKFRGQTSTAKAPSVRV